MKFSLSIERILQGAVGIVFCMCTVFAYRAIVASPPDTAWNKVESSWQGNKEGENMIKALDKNLERIRQPEVLVTEEKISNLRNVFTPPLVNPNPKDWFCEECGGANKGDMMVCRHCGAIRPPSEDIDSDNDGMPDYWEVKYGFDPQDPSDASLDADNDGSSNVEEYRKGTNPRGGSEPVEQSLPFYLVKTYQKPIQILFMGYILHPDGHYAIEINWAGRTEFYKLGDEVRGYEIKEFNKVIEDKPMPTGVILSVDKSYIVCQKKKFPPKTFIKQQLVTDNDVFAKVRFTEDQEPIEVNIDSVIEPPGSGKMFKVTDIGLTPQKIIVVDETKKTYTVRIEK
ncbi:MAG: hypothetical protein JW774_12620 [Candidatus Aureabacteria bacterium]|nr:hypothetical protein [Candidatus Auribacterota bacterium]